MRVFFAIMLPREVQQRIAGLRSRLEWIPIRGNWTPAENIHITLKFVGEVSDSAVVELIEAMSSCQFPPGPLQLSADCLVPFPPAGPVRVLGVGFSGDTGSLVQINTAIEALCAEFGYLREPRAYVPHATLARFKDGLHRRHVQRVEECCAEELRSSRPFAATEVQLMQSHLSSQGSRYARLAGWRLNERL